MVRGAWGKGLRETTDHSLRCPGNKCRVPHISLVFEVRIVRTHVDERLLMDGEQNRIDPDKWRPLIMSFCRFYGLGEQVWQSTLAEIPEAAYRPVPQMMR